jgi:hypothetical protein
MVISNGIARRSLKHAILPATLMVFFGLQTCSTRGADFADCRDRITAFVTEVANILATDENSVQAFQAPIRKYFPIQACDKEEVLAISMTSKFFDEVYDTYSGYTISLKSKRFIVSFFLKKNNGDIEYPSARTRFLFKD